MPQFSHLHCHTQYSLLDGAADIGKMMDKAKADGQTAVALTDHGNMFGAFKFVAEARKRDIKPIVGCEFYLVEDRHKRSFLKSAGEKDKRYHQLLLAKNKTGYQNLSKLCSFGFKEGLYSKFPRIDKELLLQYHEGIIATSCCIGAEVPQTILKGQTEKAEELLKWWLNVFGDDYYIELQRHTGLESIDDTGMSQEDVNQILLGFARKHNVKVIATNDSHYVEEEDSPIHDILLCVNTGSNLLDPNRFKFPSTDFYFKTQAEMNQIFSDVPEAIDNTMEIASKVDVLELARDVVLPAYPLPVQFDSQDLFLRHLTFEGAKKRYANITAKIEERLNFELEVIKNSGYPGYFLIVQDFTSTARDMGVSVGPGRGSAAGSAVAYCLGITNIDPIKYDLLFERFLNPERVSMPDIDIDFDDEGRSKVIDYVIDKYGQNQVAQIITYGTMAARSSLRDVGRVMQVPLSEVDRVAKTFPAHLSASLNKVLAKGGINPKLKSDMVSEDVEKAVKFRQLSEEKSQIGDMIRSAKALEGSIRNTGIHACGVIITPDDITNYVPVSVAKGSDLLVSQFDNSVVEDAGLLKMDFLGLKTLTIIKDAVEIIKSSHKVSIDIDEIPLEDKETYELFQRGETVGIFQYESVGMQKSLKDLKPDKFLDLIAMNALYRPGPMQYIPNFVARKHGREEIKYDLDDMEEFLSETYGITVYQEQVMLLSQKLAGFSKGQADMLRKAMGKKKKKLIDQMYPDFEAGCAKNGYPPATVEKIWKDWEAFASYAFNKSHSTCYAFIAFQTAYLKAHYPAAFMASVLNHNKNNIDSLNKFLRECKRMKLEVLGPDINESKMKFHVNDKGQIRFGLSAIKGVGEGPVDAILEERENGEFTGIFDITKRVSLRSVNKKCLESLVLSGALDSFEQIRSSYFAESQNFNTLLEHAIRFGNTYQGQIAQNQNSLFGDISNEFIQEPEIPKTKPWPLIVKLEKEKEVTGIYLSGHPLDDYRLELENFTTCSLDKAEQLLDRNLKLAGLVTEAFHGTNQKGLGYGRFVVQDFNGALEFRLYRDDYLKYRELLNSGQVVYIEGKFTNGYNDNLYFKVNNIRLLDTVGKALTKSITLQLGLHQINDKMITHINTIIEQCKGNHGLSLEIIDLDDELDIQLVSPSRKVNADSGFIQELESIGIRYKLN